MDREKLEERINELLEELSKQEPGSKEYKNIVDNIETMWRTALEDEKVYNDRLDRNRRYDLEEMKYESEKREAQKKAKADWIKLATTIGSGVIMVGGTILTVLIVAAIEEKTIVSSKVWSIIGWLRPKLI